MRFILIVLATILAPVTGLADTTREDKITYIIETENLRDQILAYNEQLIIRTMQELDKHKNLNLDEQQKVAIRDELETIVQEYIDDYVRDISAVYDNHLTDDELNALYNFYRSPEGISIGEKLPQAWSDFFWVDARYIELLSKRSMSRVMDILTEEDAN